MSNLTFPYWPGHIDRETGECREAESQHTPHRCCEPDCHGNELRRWMESSHRLVQAAEKYLASMPCTECDGSGWIPNESKGKRFCPMCLSLRIAIRRYRECELRGDAMSEKPESRELFVGSDTPGPMKPSGWWQCGICDQVHHSKEGADRCCLCVYCGKLGDPRKRGDGSVDHVDHRACADVHFAQQDANVLAAAETDPGYGGPVMLGGRFFKSAAELVRKWYAGVLDDPETGARPPRPEFLHTMGLEPAQIDGLRVLDELLDGLRFDNDELPDIAGSDELLAAFDAFNRANAGNGCWRNNIIRKVRIPWPEGEGCST